MKIMGLLATLLGWLIPVAGLAWTTSSAARLILCLVGLGMCLVGILGFLNGAYMKHALWKR